MITVNNYDKLKGLIFLQSDAKGVADQMTELRQPGVEDIALRFAAENGIVIDGTMDLGGRNLRFYDSVTEAEINPARALRGDIPENPVICRRLVKLAVSSSIQSSIANLPIAPKYEKRTEPADKPKPAKSKR